VVIKAALAGVDPVAMVTYRFLIAAGVLLPIVLFTGRRLLSNISIAIPTAVVMWLIHMPQTLGLKYTTASNAGFITGLFVLFVPFFMITVFKHRPRKGEFVASIVALAGLWILTGGMVDVNIGDGVVLVGAVAYAFHVLLSDKYMKGGIDPILFSCQQFLIAGLLSIVVLFAMDLPLGVEGGEAWFGVIFVALVPTLSAFLIQMMAQRITRPVRVALIFATQPIFAAVFSWTIGGEEIVSHRAFGGLFIVVALIIAALTSGRRDAEREA